MTDNEIIKALECCTGYPSCPTDCPLYEQPVDCLLKLSKPTLDLINRQKAEIERLQAEAQMADGYEDALCERVRAEAAKEFAERLDDSLCKNIGPSRRLYWKISADIDNLVKEMVGEDK